MYKIVSRSLLGVEGKEIVILIVYTVGLGPGPEIHRRTFSGCGFSDLFNRLIQDVEVRILLVHRL